MGSEPDLQVLAQQIPSIPNLVLILDVALGGNIITDAFDIVAMVAMTPLITIQIMGVIFKVKESKRHKNIAAQVIRTSLDDYGDMEIIEL